MPKSGHTNRRDFVGNAAKKLTTISDDLEDWAPSKALGAKCIYAALQALKENGGQLDSDAITEAVASKVQFDAWATETYQKTGYIRWQSMLHFFSIDCVKAGYLIKKKGVWYLTPEGEKAIDLGLAGLFLSANRAYKEWRQKNPKKETFVDDDNDEAIAETATEISLERAQQTAIEGIKNHLFAKSPYEFQDICAALFRAMGYHTPFIAPPGKDGGIDVIAYRDPLGTHPPRIKAQIKHRKDTSVSVQEVRQLMGLLKADDCGLFISTGGFSSDAKSTARTANGHIELIDLDRFIDLWTQFFKKLPEEDQNRLPLVPVYFVG